MFNFLLIFYSCFASIRLDPEKICLSIDGGGVRGVLEQIENKTKKNICEIFKGGITGTSTGALIALCLSARKSTDPNSPDFNKPLYSSTELVKFYQDKSGKIFESWTASNCCANLKEFPNGCFPGTKELISKVMTCFGCLAICRNCNGICGPKYSNNNLIKELKDIFTECDKEKGTSTERTLKDVIVPVQIVTFNIDKNGGPLYLNSKEHPTIKMSDAALASASAPTFFPPHTFSGPTRTFHCVDGGIFDNNPVFAALGFAIYLHESQKKCKVGIRDFYVLSIGTGKTQLDLPDYTNFRRFGLIGWAPQAVDLAMRGTSVGAEINMRRMLDIDKYTRIQCTIDKNFSKMDHNSLVEPLYTESQCQQVVSSKLKCPS